MTGSSILIHSPEDQVSKEFFHHSSARRVNTDVVLVEALRKRYPNLDLVISPQSSFNLIAYASAGFATAELLDDSKNDPVYGAALTWRAFIPPSRRLDGGPGGMAERILFGKFMYKWKGHEFLLYIANGRDGTSYYPEVTNHYILTRNTHQVDALIKEATLWAVELHDEVWVFDQGYWSKSRELWDSVQKSRWSDVILEEDMKRAIIADVENFFDNRQTYQDLKVPWKRGIIYYGPPGNGKTISIKAMMHSLYQRGKGDNTKQSVPTLYVRSLASWAGPEYALQQIFAKARQEAPCYLVFEDLDSIVDDNVRSYFLNEVDGLKPNDGILMVGSTNHLDRLDPGISKRPSRFDRKYFFPDPDFAQRVKYAAFWQEKLKDNDDVEFPDELCAAVAKITDGFSFAYMQEAFVAALLAIAVGKTSVLASATSAAVGTSDRQTRLLKMNLDDLLSKDMGPTDDDKDSGLDDLLLWKELKKQVKILREEMESERYPSPPKAPAPPPQPSPPMPYRGPAPHPPAPNFANFAARPAPQTQTQNPPPFVYPNPHSPMPLHNSWANRYHGPYPAPPGPYHTPPAPDIPAQHAARDTFHSLNQYTSHRNDSSATNIPIPPSAIYGSTRAADERRARSPAEEKAEKEKEKEQSEKYLKEVEATVLRCRDLNVEVSERLW